MIRLELLARLENLFMICMSISWNFGFSWAGCQNHQY